MLQIFVQILWNLESGEPFTGTFAGVSGVQTKCTINLIMDIALISNTDIMSAGRQTRTSVTKLKVTPSKSPSPSSVVVDSTAESGCQNCTQLLATQNQLLATQAELLRTIKELNTRIGSLETTVANLQKNTTVADDEPVGYPKGTFQRD